MMYAIVAAIIGAVLLIVNRMLSQARADRALAKIDPVKAKQEAEEFIKEFARLTEEIKNADLKYDTARRSALNPRQGAGLSGSNPGGGSGDPEKK